MAKRRKVKLKRKAVGRPPSERGARQHVIAIKAYPEWKDWLDEMRVSEGLMNLVDVIDAALKEWAKAKKRREPPPR